MRYWSAQVTGGAGHLLNEIDDVAWLDVPSAHSRLDYARDRDQLLALVRLQQTDRLDTWPLVLVRHAHAVPRGSWKRDDPLRPLDTDGQAAGADAARRARGLRRHARRQLAVRAVPGHRRAVCRVRRLRLRTHAGLSEEGFEADPAKAPRHLARLLDRGEPALLCTHGPVLPTLLDDLERRLDLDAAGSVQVVEEFAEARDDKLHKGEALVCHVVGRGADARVVAVERHLP